MALFIGRQQTQKRKLFFPNIESQVAEIISCQLERAQENLKSVKQTVIHFIQKLISALNSPSKKGRQSQRLLYKYYILLLTGKIYLIFNVKLV